MNEMSFAEFGKSEFVAKVYYVIPFIVTGVKDYSKTVLPPYRFDKNTYRAELDITGHPAEPTISIVEMFQGGKLVVKDFNGNLRAVGLSIREDVYGVYLHATLENIPSGKVQCTLYELRSADGKVRWRNPDA